MNVYIKTLFDGVNRYEREQFPTKMTAIMFRKLTETINLLDEFGKIPDHLIKISKNNCYFSLIL